MASGAVMIGMEGYVRKLEKLKTSDPVLAKMLEDAIRQMVKDVRSELVGKAKSGLQMESDPRNAVRAIRSTVYKRIFGANVNLLNGRRRAGNVADATGGKREYVGKERGFVLRFLNQGTKDRYVGFRNNKANQKTYDAMVASGNRAGYRGHIEARNWFSSASTMELERASEVLEEYINRVIIKMME